jgi:hypothetical protein
VINVILHSRPRLRFVQSPEERSGGEGALFATRLFAVRVVLQVVHRHYPVGVHCGMGEEVLIEVVSRCEWYTTLPGADELQRELERLVEGS